MKLFGNRPIFASVAAATAMLIVAGCGTGTPAADVADVVTDTEIVVEEGETAAPAAAPAEGAQGEATAWTLTGGPEQMFRSSFDSWNSGNPDRQINYEFFANDAYKERIRTAVGAGQAPTLLWSWGGATLNEYVDHGNVIPLGDAAQAILDHTIPSVVDNATVDGQVYAVPANNVQPVMLFCNQDVLDAAGVSVPQTYQDMLDMIGPLQDDGIIPFAVAGQSQWPYLMWIQYLTDRIGGPEVFTAVVNGEPGAWDNPAILEATTKIRELVDAGAFGNAFGSVNADQQGDTALVHTGRAACVLHGAWVFPDFVNFAPELVEEGKIVTAAFPTVDGGVGDPANITGNPSNFWSVSADASPEAQAIAIDFINRYVQSDSAIDAMIAEGTIPPISGIEDRLTGQPNEEFLKFAYNMVDQAPHFQLSWDQALPGAQAEVLLTNLSQLFLGQITPEQFQANMGATL